MKRRSFVKSAAAVAAVSAVNPVLAGNQSVQRKEIIELREYHFSGGGGTRQLQSYISEALVPLANKSGVKVGAFGEYSLDDPPKVYILLTYPDFGTLLSVQNEMKSNRAFLDAANSYLTSDPATPVFTRYETFLMEAFDGIPTLKLPEKSRGLFEWRTYEGYNEDAVRRKIIMFDEEELPLFEKTGLHPVFFGKILAGRQMPALSYMLWFKDMEERTANWARFSSSPEWNTMRVKPEYANTVSKVNKKFLVPLDYSQI